MKDASKKYRKNCKICNKPFSTADESVELCRECMARQDFEKRRAEDEERKHAAEVANEVFETRKCVDCGNEFDVKNGERDFLEGHGYRLPNRCPECRKLRKDFAKRGFDEVGLETTCVDCGEKLTFTNRQLYWYVARNYAIPTRCASCRKKRNDFFARRKERREKDAVAKGAGEETPKPAEAPASNVEPKESATLEATPEKSAS